MRSLLAASLLLGAPLSEAAEQVVVLGDSLSKEYEFSFRLDGFSNASSVRNWIEILDTERRDFFDQGSHIDVNFLFLDIFFRHQYNWSVPGSKIAQISSFLRGEIEFLEFYTSNNPTTFEQVIGAIASLVDDGDFDLADLDDQIRNTAERVVFFAGGNDADEVYREIYEADPSFDSQAWSDAFLNEAQFIIDWVLERNPTIEFVVVALPHVGITPNVKASHPPDPVKTARVTTVMRSLNLGLARLASDRGIAFANIFEPMLRLLDPAPGCLQGVPFANDVPPGGSDPGDLEYLWLNGTASDGFHPNTSAQLAIANEIVRAFNGHYRHGIAPLSANEMLQDWLGKDPDISFTDWRSCYGLAGAGRQSDDDLDGLPLALEFMVGADPLRFDPWQVRFQHGADTGNPFLEVSYALRLPGTAEGSVHAESSTDLINWTPLPSPSTADPDGLFRARLPINSNHAFLRLGATVP